MPNTLLLVIIVLITLAASASYVSYTYYYSIHNYPPPFKPYPNGPLTNCGTIRGGPQNGNSYIGNNANASKDLLCLYDAYKNNTNATLLFTAMGVDTDTSYNLTLVSHMNASSGTMHDTIWKVGTFTSVVMSQTTSTAQCGDMSFTANATTGYNGLSISDCSDNNTLFIANSTA